MHFGIAAVSETIPLSGLGTLADLVLYEFGKALARVGACEQRDLGSHGAGCRLRLLEGLAWWGNGAIGCRMYCLVRARGAQRAQSGSE